MSDSKEENVNNRFDSIKHFLSGGTAGALSRSITAPLAKLKYYIQVSDDKATIHAIYHTMKSEGGLRHMWRGNLVNVFKYAYETAIRFALYDYFKNLLQNRNIVVRDLTFSERMLSGCLSGFIAQTCLYPMDVLRLRMVLGKPGQYLGIVHAIRTIYSREGLRAFGRGYVPHILGVLPYYGLDLSVYETLKQFVNKRTVDDVTVNKVFLIGGLSSIIAQFFTYPCFLVCSKMQAESKDIAEKNKYLLSKLQTKSKDIEENKYPISSIQRESKDIAEQNKSLKMRDIVRKIWQKNGIIGLYRGFSMNIFVYVPMTGITYVTYEFFNKIMGIKMV